MALRVCRVPGAVLAGESHKRVVEAIKKFFGLLERQGLLVGRLKFQEREYRYSRDVGYREIPPDPAAGDTHRADTIAREDTPFESEISAKKRSVRKYIWISISLISLAALAVVAYTLRLEKKPSIDTMNKSEVNAQVGEDETVGEASLPPFDVETDPGDKQAEIGGAAAETDSKGTTQETERDKPRVEAKGEKTELAKDPVREPTPSPETAKPERRETAGPTRLETQTLLIHNLRPGQIRLYSQKLKTVRVTCDEKLKLSGYFTVKLDIDADGSLKVVGYNADGMTVKPKRRKGRAIQSVLSALAGIRLSPPRDKQGRRARVKNWRLNFQVSFYQERIILRKQ